MTTDVLRAKRASLSRGQRVPSYAYSVFMWIVIYFTRIFRGFSTDLSFVFGPNHTGTINRWTAIYKCCDRISSNKKARVKYVIIYHLLTHNTIILC